MNWSRLCKIGFHCREPLIRRWQDCKNVLGQSKTVYIDVWGCVDCGKIFYLYDNTVGFIKSYPLVEQLLTDEEKSMIELFKSDPKLYYTWK